jgi:hypothetical protein
MRAPQQQGAAMTEIDMMERARLLEGLEPQPATPCSP